MLYDIFLSTDKLKNIIKQYIVINSLEGINKLLFLPDGCNFIVFNRGIKGFVKVYNSIEKICIPDGYCVSLKSNKVRQISLDDENILKDVIFPIIIVELEPIGFYKLFNIDAASLNNKYLTISQESIDSYFKKLYTHKTIEDELNYLNSSLVALYNSQNNSYLPIEDMLDKIVNSYYYEVSVDSLTEEFGYSRSKIERDFKKIIGLTPKNFIFTSKFSKTVLSYVEDECSFKDMEYLYSDNSYMNAVFKKFLGVGPSVVFEKVRNNKISIYQINNAKKRLK